MNLPKQYEWLSAETGPRVIREALALYGVKEKPGSGSNPVIVGWADEIGGDVDRDYTADVIPWCGLFVAIVVRRSGFAIPRTPLWARAWADWGHAADKPSLGDVLVFSRQGGGHVGFYVGEDATHFHVLGGNQGDEVNIRRIARSRLIAARRCPWKIVQPVSVRVIKLAAAGTVSTSEA